MRRAPRPEVEHLVLVGDIDEVPRAAALGADADDSVAERVSECVALVVPVGCIRHADAERVPEQIAECCTERITVCVSVGRSDCVTV